MRGQALLILTASLYNKKASNKKLDSQISYFNRKLRDLIIKYNENSLLKNKKSRLSFKKATITIILIIYCSY